MEEAEDAAEDLTLKAPAKVIQGERHSRFTVLCTLHTDYKDTSQSFY